jgi:hypothetical protein
VTDVDRYLASVAAHVRGAGARRLGAELRDHLEDAIAHHVGTGCDPSEAARIALERLGPADELLAAWSSRARVRRVQARRRAALVAFAAVSASALALVQHASGREPTGGTRIVTQPVATAPHCFPAGKRHAALSGHDPGGGRRSGANPLRCTGR